MQESGEGAHAPPPGATGRSEGRSQSLTVIESGERTRRVVDQRKSSSIVLFRCSNQLSCSPDKRRAPPCKHSDKQQVLLSHLMIEAG